MRCRHRKNIYQNSDTGYTVSIYTTKDTSVPLAARNKMYTTGNNIAFTAIGFELPLTDKIELEMEGEWDNSDYGLQFKIDRFAEIVPRTQEGITGYLSSGAIKGIGPRTAESIFKKFGLRSLEVMENTPDELLKIKGITQTKLAGIRDSLGKNSVFRELMAFLAPYKVSPKKVSSILETFQDNAVNIIRCRPYMLCNVKGFGFLTVDNIARQLCSVLNDPMRISGCIGYILKEAMKEGHLYLEQDVLIKKSFNILNDKLPSPVVNTTEISQVLYRLVMQKSIILEEQRVYIVQQYQEEEETARMIAERLILPLSPIDIEKEMEMAQKDLGIMLSERQRQAVRMVFTYSTSIITGGPGTGKTTVLKVILYIHEMLYGSRVNLMAPTGRAARRMAESTGYQDACTMHMALGLIGDMTDFNAMFECLDEDFLNVDEMSMVDMHVGYEFFRRVKSTSRILLVGDVNQLPSVGAGDVFRQLITCGLIPYTVLDLIYRQGADSNIPVNAQLMQEGKTCFQTGSDFEIIECKGSEEAAELVKNIYLKEITNNGMEEVQILTPYKRSNVAGSNKLNTLLQDLVNSPAKGKREVSVSGQVFRVGDKIMQNKNTETVSNGDMGVVSNIYTDMDGGHQIVLQFSNNRKVEYDTEQMDMVEHANAITIHKFQGSECAVVIIPWVKAFYRMLKRNILYTGITRAKTKVYLVGEWSAICQAVKTDDSGKRNTQLGAKIIQYYHLYQKQKIPEAEQLKLAV